MQSFCLDQGSSYCIVKFIYKLYIVSSKIDSGILVYCLTCTIAVGEQDRESHIPTIDRIKDPFRVLLLSRTSSVVTPD